MSSYNIAKRILEKIKEQGLHPKPKWHFRLKSVFLWFIFAIVVIVGGMAVSVIVFMAKNSDWDLFSRFGSMFILETLPYFWLIILAMFSILAYIDFKQTKEGYRFHFYTVFSGAIGLSLVLGFIFYAGGFGQAMEFRMQRSFPLYNRFFVERPVVRKMQVWFQPERGLLIGTVVSLNPPRDFKMQDFFDKVWLVRTSDFSIMPPFPINEGDILKIIGEKINNDIFDAVEIRPWIDPHQFTKPTNLKERFRMMRIR